MGVPAQRDIENHLTRAHQLTPGTARAWAKSLRGLDWRHIKPLVQLAVNSKTSPMLAIAAITATTSDPDVAATLTRHVEHVSRCSSRPARTPHRSASPTGA